MSEKCVDPIDEKVVVNIDTPEGRAFYNDIESNTCTMSTKDTGKLCNVTNCVICGKVIHTPVTEMPKHICDECADRAIVFNRKFESNTVYLSNDIKYIEYKGKKYSVEELAIYDILKRYVYSVSDYPKNELSPYWICFDGFEGENGDLTKEEYELLKRYF